MFHVKTILNARDFSEPSAAAHQIACDVDEAAFLTLKTGGQVWVVDRDEFPEEGDAVAAVLRYPQPVGQ